MRSVMGEPAVPCGGAPTMAEGAAAWSELSAALSARARLDARIVGLAGQVVSSGTIERIEGLPLEQVLGLTHRLPHADRSMLLTAAEVLRDMPATGRLFAEGVLSWGQVRGIVAEAKRLPREQRGELDAMIGASADLFAKWDPDTAVDAVRVAAMGIRGEQTVQRNERTAARGNFVYAQPGLFERGKVYGEFDNTSLAAITRGMDDAAPADDGRSLGRRRADGLLALALHRCDETLEACGDQACTDCTVAAADPTGGHRRDGGLAGRGRVGGGAGAARRARLCAHDLRGAAGVASVVGVGARGADPRGTTADRDPQDPRQDVARQHPPGDPRPRPSRPVPRVAPAHRAHPSHRP
ncbi:MAG TPA: DUF222 domain-containing protein [Egibacteraceae bacterium]|nr:DUF222 domain-containing protein [Egibacteraceae bacterium]